MPEPMRPIQQTPQGLAALLRLQMRGEMPSELLASVQPSIDLEQWYLRSKVRQWPALPLRSMPTFSDQFVTWVAAADVIQVPQGVWWWVEYLDIHVLVPAGDAVYNAQCAYEPGPSVPTGRFTTVGPAVSFSTAGLGAVGLNISAANFWVPPGAYIGTYVGYIAPLTDYRLGNLRYVPLELSTG